MTFVGTVINFSGNDQESILHRLTQAAKSHGAWRRFFQSPRVAVNKLLKLLISTVETWLPTKQQKRASDCLGRKDGLQRSRVQFSLCSYGRRSILESATSKCSPTSCQRGHHGRRPPAHLCSKIKSSRTVATAQDPLSVMVAA